MPTVSVVAMDNPNDIKEFEVENDSLVFDALDNLGLKLPHGCLAGSCGACKCIILEGSENLTPPGAVESDTIANIEKSATEKHGADFLAGKSVRLTCRSKISGDIKIQPLKV